MNAWELLAWTTAISLSIILATAAGLILTAGVKAIKRSGNRRRTVDD